jgi:hypothetical protein
MDMSKKYSTVFGIILNTADSLIHFPFRIDTLANAEEMLR